jgi:hypothetical protein
MKTTFTKFHFVVPALILACLIVTIQLPSLWFRLALLPCGGLSALGIVGIATYWLVLGSPAQFIVASTCIVLSIKALGQPLGWRTFLSVWLGGAIVGGMVYSCLGKACSPLVGPYPLSWAFGGYAFITVISTWKTHPTWVKVYAAILGNAVLTLLFLPVSDIAISAAPFAYGALLVKLLPARPSIEV